MEEKEIIYDLFIKNDVSSSQRGEFVIGIIFRTKIRTSTNLT